MSRWKRKMHFAAALCFFVLISVQLVCNGPVGDSTRWLLNETRLTCNESTQQQHVAAGQYDAVFVEVRVNPDFQTLFCSNNSILRLILSTSETLGESSCPVESHIQWMVYENTGISMTVERMNRECEWNGSFWLNVTYQSWSCWEAVKVSSEHIPVQIDDLCGLIQASDSDSWLSYCDHVDVYWCTFINSRLPSFVKNGTEILLEIHFTVTPLDPEHLLPNPCYIKSIQLSTSDHIDLCESSRRQSITLRQRSFEIRTTYLSLDKPTIWVGNTFFSKYLTSHPNITARRALFHFYDIIFTLKFGILSRKYRYQDDDKMVPIQIRQNSLDMTIRLPPVAILSFSSFIYRIAIQASPGKHVAASWQPLSDVNYSFLFADSSIEDPLDLYSYVLGQIFG